jgi:hypothetical protein
VDRAGSHDQQESVIAAGEYVDDLVAMGPDGVGEAGPEGQFGPDLFGWRHGAEGDDAPIGGAFDVKGGAGDGHDVGGLPVSGSQGVPVLDPVP